MLHAPITTRLFVLVVSVASGFSHAVGPLVHEAVPVHEPVATASEPTATVEPAQAGQAGVRSQDLIGPPVKPEAVRSVDSRRPLGLPRAESSPAPAGPSPAGASMPDWAWQLGALGLVIGSILVIGAVVRRVAPAAGLMGALGARGRAPSGVLEVLGRYPVSRGSMLVLLKVDRRVLLLNQTSGRGGTTMTTLAEITDPAEVASLVAKTNQGTAVGQQFERTLERVGGDAAPPVERAASRVQPAARRKPVSPAADLDAAAVAQSLRSKLAAMQNASPGAPAAAVREFSA